MLLSLSLGLEAIAFLATLEWQLPAQRALDRAGWSDAMIYPFAHTFDRQRAGFLRRRIIVPLFLSATAVDHEIGEAMIRQSRLDWGHRAAADAHQRCADGRYRAGEALREETPLLRVSRADVADFMLRQLHDDHFLRRSPSLAPSGEPYDQRREGAS